LLELALKRFMLVLRVKGIVYTMTYAYSEIFSGGVLTVISLSHASLHSWMILRAKLARKISANNRVRVK
jgi:hypothetical protein